MTVGFLKRLLTFVNIAAVLGIAGTAYGFWTHHSSMKEAVKPPNFNPVMRNQTNTTTRIDNTVMQLGQFPKAEVKSEATPEKEPEPEIEKEIDRLGTIKGAIVVFPPYTRMKPAIIFEYKTPLPGMDDRIVTIQVGEALITRPHSDPARREWGDRENVRFTFLRCEPDPKRPGKTLFVFDTHGDGKNIQRARWKGEIEKTALPQAGPDQPKNADEDEFVRPADWRTRLGKKKPGATKPTEVKPVPAQPKPSRTPEMSGPIFENRRGTLETTDEGLEYLRKNHQDLLKGATTSQYQAPDGTRGIKVRRFVGRTKSVADQFGLREGDVILSVNGKKVGSKTQAIDVVKRELNNKVRYIEIRILRLGNTKTLRFDARDAETRRRAQEAFRNR